MGFFGTRLMSLSQGTKSSPGGIVAGCEVIRHPAMQRPQKKSPGESPSPLCGLALWPLLGSGGCTPQKTSGFYDPVLKKTQLTFSTQDVTKAFDKLDAPHLLLVTILYVHARRGVLQICRDEGPTT